MYALLRIFDVFQNEKVFLAVFIGGVSLASIHLGSSCCMSSIYAVASDYR